MMHTHFDRSDGSTNQASKSISLAFLAGPETALGKGSGDEHIVSLFFHIPLLVVNDKVALTLWYFYIDRMTLARREMAMTLATIFLRYDVYRGQAGPTLELYDTTRARDIDADSDYIIPVPEKGSVGLRVKIRN